MAAITFPRAFVSDQTYLGFQDLMTEAAEQLDGTPSTKLQDGTITIGYGYTFFRNGQLYSNAINDFNSIGVPLTQTEINLLNQIQSAPAANKSALMNQFVAAWTQPGLTPAQGEKLLNLEIPRAIADMQSIAAGIIGAGQAATLFSNLANTPEMSALVDLYYMAHTFIGKNLITALNNGDRAEAWFQIRYGWSQNPKYNDGWAARHFMQSTVFGLYDDPDHVRPDEVVNVYSMLQQHRGKILQYENSFDTDISSANTKYSAVLQGAGVGNISDIVTALQPAEDALFTQLKSTYANDPEVLSILNQESLFNSTNIYLTTNTSVDPQTVSVNLNLPGAVTTGDNLLLGGNWSDTLVGGSGSDLLIGGSSGHEELIGGAGDDTLIGSGNDTLQSGSGNDTLVVKNAGITVIQSDSGDGSVWVDGVSTALGSGLIRVESLTQQETWIDGNGLQYQFSSTNGASTGTLKITGGTLGGEVDIQNFDLAQAENTPQGYLGFTIAKSVELLPGISQGGSGSFGGGGQPVNSNITLASGGEQTFTVALDAPCETAQSITLKLNGGTAADYFCNIGDGQLSFSGGSVTLTIPAGQQSITFALVNSTPLTQTENVQLVATLAGSDSSTITSNLVSVNVDAGTPNPMIGTPQTNSVITAQNLDATTPADAILVYFGDGKNDLIQVVGGYKNFINAGDGNNVIQANNSDHVEVGSGNNLIRLSDTGGVNPENWDPFYGTPGVLLGNGNNTVVSASGGSYYAGVGFADVPGEPVDGNNLIIGNNAAGKIVLGSGENHIYLGAQVDNIATAIEQAKTGVASGQQGTLVMLGDGDNTVIGSKNNDLIITGQGNNLIVGGPGKETITGGMPHDLMAIGDGQKNSLNWSASVTNSMVTLSGVDVGTLSMIPTDDYEGVIYNASEVGFGNDTIFAGKGDSFIFLSNGNNYVDAGGGNDSIIGGMGRDTIYGSTGNVLVTGGGGDTYIDGESGDDTLIGQGGNNTIFGGSGNSSIYAGGSSSNWADSYSGKNYFNYVDGGSGNVTIFGSGGNDTLIGGNGDDFIYGGNGTELLIAGNGDTQLVAGTGDDTLIGGKGADALFGGAGNNVIYAGDGGTAEKSTQIVAGSGNTTIYGGLGIDHIWGGSGTNIIYAGDGGTDDAHTMVLGGSGPTTIYGGAGVAVLEANQSTDIGTRIVAGAGTSTLIGGSGQDTLVAGVGDAVFIGDITGRTIAEFDNGFGSVELTSGSAWDLHFGAGISASDLSITADLNSSGTAVLEIFGEGSIVLDGGLTDTTSLFSFAEGNTYSLAQLLAQADTQSASVVGAQGVLQFSAGEGDSLAAGSGHDTISAWGSGANITGGTGNSLLAVGGDDAVITAGSGNDTLMALGGGETLVGGSGNSTLIAASNQHVTLRGGSGNDTFVIHNNIDVIEVDANSGNDVVQSSVSYSLGDNLRNLTLTGYADLYATGNDLDNVITGNNGHDTLVAGGGNDTLISGSALTTMYGGSGTDTFVVNNSADVIFGAYNSSVVQSSVDFALPDSVEYLQLTGSANLTAKGNKYNAVITGNAGNDSLIAGDGNQTLISGTGIDTLIGGFGSNTFVVNNSADIVQAKAGAGSNAIQSSVDYVLSDNVTNLTLIGNANLQATGNTMNDVIVANSGDDTLVSGSGNDTLYGGAGNDTYRLNAHFGHDEIIDTSHKGTIQFGDGITVDALTVGVARGSDGSPALVINDGNNSVTIDEGLYGAIDQFQFANGSTLTLQQLLSQLPDMQTTVSGASGDTLFTSLNAVSLIGGMGNDTLFAAGDNDTLIAGNGDQQLFAIGNNATLIGGIGYTALNGGQGNDTYVLARGGIVEINATATAGTETLQLPIGMSLGDFQASRRGQDLLLSSQASDTIAVVKNYFDTQRSDGQWMIANANGQSQSLQDWFSQQASSQSNYASQVDAARVSFNAEQQLSLWQLGRNGSSLGSLPKLDGTGAEYFGNEYYADFEEDNPLNIPDYAALYEGSRMSSYRFDGVAVENYTVTGNGQWMADSAEHDSLEWLEQQGTYVRHNPIYATVVTSVTPGDKIPLILYSETDNLGNPIDPVIVDIPNTQVETREVEVGFTTSLVNYVYTGVAASRTYSVDHIVGGNSSNADIVASGPFRGTISLGDGDNYVNLGAGDPTDASDIWSLDDPQYQADRSLDEPGAFIQAGNGTDTVVGTEANDVFVAGNGLDFFAGGVGSDTYYVPLTGHSTVLIDDEQALARDDYSAPAPWQLPIAQNRLVLPEGVNPEDLSYRIITDSSLTDNPILQLSYGQSNVFIVEVDTHSSQPIETGIQQFQFADGSVLSESELLSRATQLSGDDASLDVDPDTHVIKVGTTVVQGNTEIDSWTDSDGGHGSYTYYDDGSWSGVVYNTDDSVNLTDTGNDAGDNLITSYLNGSIVSDTWHHSDGAHGSDVFNVDGSLQQSITIDNSGSSLTSNYVNGVVRSDSWLSSDGSSGSDIFNSDGSLQQSTSLDSSGFNLQTDYFVNGLLVADIWQNLFNGMSGSESLDYDGNGLLIRTVSQDNTGTVVTTDYVNGEIRSQEYVSGSYTEHSYYLEGSSEAGYNWADTNDNSWGNGTFTGGSHFGFSYASDGSLTNAFVDYVTGNHVDFNLINGTQADEVLTGTAGADALNAVSFNDTLIGGLGDDVLIAGTGKIGRAHV